MAELKTYLQGTGRRMTSQRTAVYSALCATSNHPTAEELYLMIRDTMPNISLATVYNNLEMLVQTGLAMKLTGDRSARYDGICDPHAHAHCTHCGRVLDMPTHDISTILDTLRLPEGFTASSAIIEVVGICQQCINQK